MKKILLGLALSSALFAANTECDSVINKLENQIIKLQNQKKQDIIKLEYLQNQKEEISKNCIDGNIDKSLLKQIITTTKHEYEIKKIQAEQDKINKKQEKLDNKKEKINKKHQKEIDKLNKKQSKKEEKKKKENKQ